MGKIGTSRDFGKRVESLLRRMALWVLLAVIGATSRITRINWHVLEGLEAQGQPYIIALWHNNIFFLTHGLLPAYRHPPLISQSRDGEDVAWLLERYGYKAVRGSGSRGSTEVLRGALRLLGKGRSICITPDGPRGPRYHLAPGVVALARKRGVPVVPICTSTTRRWELNSWDRQKLPKPFSRVALFVGDPIWLGQNGADEESERRWLEHHMREQARMAERYTGADRLYPDPLLWEGSPGGPEGTLVADGLAPLGDGHEGVGGDTVV